MSTFKRYLAIQTMMFVFGIVGPIFLIMFFASQPDPQLKWAFWCGLFITYADIIIALWITKGTLDDNKQSRDVRMVKRAQGSRGRGLDFFTSASSD